MNSKILFQEGLPVSRQDKTPPSRCYPASSQPYTPAHAGVYAHSENRQTVSASARIDQQTDIYIEHRLTAGKRLNKALTRSKVIAQMLAERARDETFEHSQEVLVPIIQDTLRTAAAASGRAPYSLGAQ